MTCRRLGWAFLTAAGLLVSGGFREDIASYGDNIAGTAGPEGNP